MATTPSASPVHTKTHTWIIVLLVWILALLLFVAGYVMYTDKTTPSPELSAEELANACANAIDREDPPPYTRNEDSDDADCPEVATTSEFTLSSFPSPSFAYPLGWQAIAYDRAFDSSLWHFIRVSPEPLWLCDGCDGPTSPVTIIVRDNTMNTTLDTLVDGQYTEGNGYSDLEKGVVTINGTEVMRIAGRKEDGFSLSTGTFEDYILVTSTTIVRVYYDGAWAEDDATVADAWATISASLDFSDVE